MQKCQFSCYHFCPLCFYFLFLWMLQVQLPIWSGAARYNCSQCWLKTEQWCSKEMKVADALEIKSLTYTQSKIYQKKNYVFKQSHLSSRHCLEPKQDRLCAADTAAAATATPSWTAPPLCSAARSGSWYRTDNRQVFISYGNGHHGGSTPTQLSQFCPTFTGHPKNRARIPWCYPSQHSRIKYRCYPSLNTVTFLTLSQGNMLITVEKFHTNPVERAMICSRRRLPTCRMAAMSEGCRQLVMGGRVRGTMEVVGAHRSSREAGRWQDTTREMSTGWYLKLRARMDDRRSWVWVSGRSEQNIFNEVGGKSLSIRTNVFEAQL